MNSAKERPSRADATRAKLLAAAVDSFARRGFHGTTTRDIATDAGLSTAALYVHYASKEALLYTISKAGHDETVDIVRAATASTSDPIAQLRQLISNFAAYHARAHTMAAIINYELHALEPEHHAEVMAIRQEIEATTRGVLERGIESGSFDILDLRMTTITLLSLGVDIARWYRDSGEWTPEDVGRHYAGLAMRIVGHRSSVA